MSSPVRPIPLTPEGCQEDVLLPLGWAFLSQMIVSGTIDRAVDRFPVASRCPREEPLYVDTW